MKSKRPLSFWLLAAFFAAFVLFLYGPMFAIFVLSFQGPEGGLTFPLRGVSLHWFAKLAEGLGVAQQRLLASGFIADPAELSRYREALGELAGHYGVEPGDARWDDDSWDAKIEVLLELRPEVVSFTFALPDPVAMARLRAAGITTAMTVTSVEEARLATDFDTLVVQGPEAGGHRGTLDPTAVPPRRPLLDLLRGVVAAVDVPVVAAGGIVDAGRAHGGIGTRIYRLHRGPDLGFGPGRIGRLLTGLRKAR